MCWNHSGFRCLLFVFLGATVGFTGARAETILVQDYFNDSSRLNTPSDPLDRSWISYHPNVDTGGQPPAIGVHNSGTIEAATLKFSGPSAHAYGVATFPTVSLAPSGNYIEIGFDFALDSAAGENADNTGPKIGLFYNNRTPLTTDNPSVTTSPTRDDRGYLLNFRRNFDGKLVLRYQDRTPESFRGGTTVGTWNPKQMPNKATHHLKVRFTLVKDGTGITAVPTLDDFTGAPVTLAGPGVVRNFNEIVVSTFTSGTTGYVDNIYVKTKVLSRTFYYTTKSDPNAFGHGSFSWDGTALIISTAELGQTPSSTINGSLKIGEGLIYSGQSGAMYQMNPVLGTFQGVSSGVNNNNVTSINPARTTIFAGWKDSPLATIPAGDAFAAGTPHNVTGDDTFASGLAWDAIGRAWYTTGDDTVAGNVGRIDLATFTTKRVLSEISATSITFDAFTGDLFTAGIDGITQINPATGKVVSSWKHPQGSGLFFQNIDATGTGQLLALDSGGLLRLWDFTAGPQLIGDPSTVEVAVEATVLDGGLALTDAAGLPVIDSPLVARATQGLDFVYQFQATNAASLEITKLPAGLGFDPALSAIVGEPTESGTFPVNLNATNAFGATNATLALTIRPAGAPGPEIISSTSATGRTNQPFRFQVISSGASPAATLKAAGLPPGLKLDPASGVISGTPTVDRSSSVALTLTDGNNITQGALQLTFTSNAALPVITSPSAATVVPNVPFDYKIVAPSTITGPDETVFTLIGDLPAGLGFDPSTGTVSGTSGVQRPPRNGAGTKHERTGAPPPPPGGVGLSGGVITNVQLFATNSAGTATLPLVFYLAPSGIVNISTRLAVGTNENVLIAGFIVDGNAPKKLIARAIGPSLTQDGSPLVGRLLDPVLDLYTGSQQLLGTNDNWRSDQEQEIIDTSIPPPDNREAAAVATLAAPGSYTAVARGSGGTTGIGLLEIYDLGTASLDATSNARLVNLSTRGLVETGDKVLIAGFIVSADATKLILRGMGPSLTAGGVTGALQDPTLDLVDSNGVIVKSDDNWRTGGQEQEIIDSTIPPMDDRESAVVATLNPGAYTAIVRGSGGTAGVGLVELYVLQ